MIVCVRALRISENKKKVLCCIELLSSVPNDAIGEEVAPMRSSITYNLTGLLPDIAQIIKRYVRHIIKLIIIQPRACNYCLISCCIFS